MRDENLRLPVRPAAIRACSAFFLAASLVFLPLACSKTNQPASPPAMQPASKPGPAPTDRIGIHWGQPAEGPFIMGLGSTGSNNAVIALKNQSEMYRSIAAYMMTRERDSKELIPAKEVQFFLVDSQGRDVPRLNQFTACIDGCSQYLAPGNAIIYSFDIRQMFKLNSNGVYRLKACFDPSGYYESTTRPEILSSGTLTIGVDLAGPPIPYEGHKLLKASEWIGLPDSQPAAPPVTQRVDGKSLLDQAAKIRSQHPAGGLEMWQALAELVKPGMTVRQMKLILPPYPSVLNREGKNATLEYPELLELHGNLFIIQYWLDKSWKLKASGNGRVIPDREQSVSRPATAGAKDKMNDATTAAINYEDNMLLSGPPKIFAATPETMPTIQTATAPASQPADAFALKLPDPSSKLHPDYRFLPIDKRWRVEENFLEPCTNYFTVVKPADREPSKKYYRELNYFASERSEPRKIVQFDPSGRFYHEIDRDISVIDQSKGTQHDRGFRPNGSIRSYSFWKDGRNEEKLAVGTDGKVERLENGRGVLHGELLDGVLTETWYIDGLEFLIKWIKDGKCIKLQLNLGHDDIMCIDCEGERLFLNGWHWTRKTGQDGKLWVNTIPSLHENGWSMQLEISETEKLERSREEARRYVQLRHDFLKAFAAKAANAGYKADQLGLGLLVPDFERIANEPATMPSTKPASQPTTQSAGVGIGVR